MLTERIRWQTMVQSTGAYKVQNSYRAFYARLLMWKFPIYAGRFKVKHIDVDLEDGSLDPIYWGQF